MGRNSARPASRATLPRPARPTSSRRSNICTRCRERASYLLTTYWSDSTHRDDFSRPALRDGSLNSLSHQVQQLQQQQLHQQEQQQEQEQQERAAQVQGAAAGEARLVASVSALRGEMLAEKARLDMSLQVRAPPPSTAESWHRLTDKSCSKAASVFVPKRLQFLFQSGFSFCTKRLQFLFADDVMRSRRCGHVLWCCMHVYLVWSVRCWMDVWLVLGEEDMRHLRLARDCQPGVNVQRPTLEWDRALLHVNSRPLWTP